MIPVAVSIQSCTRLSLRQQRPIQPSRRVATPTPHRGWISSHLTFRPRQVQQPARERCDSRGGRPDDEPDRSPREEGWALRGASGGRWPRRRCEEEEDDSSDGRMVVDGRDPPFAGRPGPRAGCVAEGGGRGKDSRGGRPMRTRSHARRAWAAVMLSGFSTARAGSGSIGRAWSRSWSWSAGDVPGEV